MESTEVKVHTQYKTERISVCVCVCPKQDGSHGFVSQGLDVSRLPLLMSALNFWV